MLDFPLDAHAGDDGYAHAHLDEAFDAFDGRHFDGHFQFGAVASEEFDDAAAVGRFDAVGDEVFVAEVFDINLALLGQYMFWRNDQGELVFQYFRGLELGLLRDVRDGTDVQPVIEHFVGNVARKHAMDANEDAGMQLAKCRESRQKSMDGTFVYPQGELASIQAFQLAKSFFHFVAEIDQTLGVV